MNQGNELFKVSKVELQARQSDMGMAHCQERTLEEGKVVKRENLRVLPELERPNSYGVYRNDTGGWLGTVGASYQPTQPQEIFDAIYEACDLTEGAIDCDNISTLIMRGGSKIVYRIPLNVVDIQVAERQTGDTVSAHLEFVSTFDGSSSFVGDIFLKRLVCDNGMTATKALDFIDNEGDARRIKWKHTQSIIRKTAELASLMVSSIEAHRDVMNLMQRFANTPYVSDNHEVFVSSLLGYSKEDVEEGGRFASKRKHMKFIALEESIDHELPSAGRNMWGLLNGVTWYTNHVVGDRRGDDKDHYLRFAQGNTLTTKAIEIIASRMN